MHAARRIQTRGDRHPELVAVPCQPATARLGLVSPDALAARRSAGSRSRPPAPSPTDLAAKSMQVRRVQSRTCAPRAAHSLWRRRAQTHGKVKESRPKPKVPTGGLARCGARPRPPAAPRARRLGLGGARWRPRGARNRGARGARAGISPDAARTFLEGLRSPPHAENLLCGAFGCLRARGFCPEPQQSAATRGRARRAAGCAGARAPAPRRKGPAPTPRDPQRRHGRNTDTLPQSPSPFGAV